MRAPSLRLRFGAGLALGAAVALLLAHAFTARARARLDAQAGERQAVVALQALGSLLAQAVDVEAARKLVAAWQAATPSVSQVRVTRGMQLVASSAAADTGERAAPRRLQRDEKPMFDRAQRLAAAVQANRDEPGSRKAEIETEALPGRRLSLAAPVEGGLIELETAALPEPPAAGVPVLWIAWLALFAIAAFFIGERRTALLVVSILCLAGVVAGSWRASAALVERDVRIGALAVAARAGQQGALVRALGGAGPGSGSGSGSAISPGLWDVDSLRAPRGQLTPDGAVDLPRLEAAVSVELGELRRAFASLGLLALAALLLAGLGALHALGVTLRKHRQAYLYIAPAIFGMLVLVFYPFSYGITLSFTDSNLYNTNQSIPQIWIGLQNYADILGQFGFVKQTDGGLAINYGNFYWTLLFTIIWTVCNVAIGVSTGLLLALALNTRALAMRPVYRILLILPWAMPNYITALIWKGMFHQQFGVVNQVLQMFGGSAVSWFDRPLTSFLTALATNGWLSFPFMMVVSLGALQSIPADLYEAARVDGATRWQQFRAITLPSLRPALVPAVILSVVWTFNMFNIIYLVTGGAPGGATEILVTQAYKYAFERYRYGYAAAYSTVIFGILLVYGTIQNRLSKATEA